MKVIDVFEWHIDRDLWTLLDERTEYSLRVQALSYVCSGIGVMIDNVNQSVHMVLEAN
jgi:hypothetical protein